MSFAYNERVQSVSPSSAKVALERGDSQRTYTVAVDSADDLYDIYREILGYTEYAPASTGGKMTRHPPKADPVFAQYFADSIPNIRGVGQPSQANPNIDIEVPTIGDFALYPQFDITVNFSQRQYSVLGDDKVDILEGSWFPDSNTDSTGSEQFFSYPNEWLRYTECFPVKPDGSYLTQQGSTIAGSMKFVGGAADGKTCAFMPSVRVPNFYVSLMWRQVPLRYITSTNSYIMNKGWQNRINQNAVKMPWNGPDDVCAPGSLLYVDFSYQAYTPATGLEWNIFGTGDMSQKLCDITLNFIWTTRTTRDTVATPSNANYIPKGHNLLYWHGDLNCHYCIIDRGDNRPTYLSAPLELLQCDPDSPQPQAIG